MAPKRKQIDDSAAHVETTRSTRAAARTKNTTAQTSSQKSTNKSSTKKATSSKTPQNADYEDSDDMDAAHITKKPRTTTANKASTAKAQKKVVGKKGDLNDDPASNGRPISSKEVSTPEVSNTLSTVDVAHSIHETNPSSPSGKAETYTPQRALELFSKYTKKDDKNVIETEGFEQLCSDANIAFDGALPLILAWQMGAKEMGKITKDEWVKGTSSLRASSLKMLSLVVTELEALLIRGCAPIKPTAKKNDYDRSAYNTYAQDVKVGFHKLYMFSYVLAKPELSKNMDMEMSLALWSVLLAPKYPIMAEVLLFINNNLEIYKATNKDLWSMMLEFCRTVDPNLQDYEADGAWPTLLDDFVSSKKSNGAVANASDS